MLESDFSNVEDNGVLVIEYDLNNRIRYNHVAGTQRVFTGEENSLADIIQARQTLQANQNKLLAAVNIQIETLNSLLGTANDPPGIVTARAIKNTPNSEINSSPAQYIKGLANIVISMLQANRRVSRILARRFEDIN